MAKSAPAAEDTPPKAKRVKRRKGAAVAVTARRRRARRSNPAPRENGWGPMWAWMDDLKTVGAGLASYGGTRLVQRLITRVTRAKKPAWTKHVHAAAGAAVFAAAVLAGRKVKQIEAYHEAIVLGTGIAAAQGVLSAYVPRYAWLMNDLQNALPAASATPTASQAAAGDIDYMEQELAAYEEQATLPRRQRAPVQQALKTAAAASGDLGLEEALVEELGDEDIDDLYGGVFQSPTLMAS